MLLTTTWSDRLIPQPTIIKMSTSEPYCGQFQLGMRYTCGYLNRRIIHVDWHLSNIQFHLREAE